MSYRRVQKERKEATYYCVRFGHSLWSAQSVASGNGVNLVTREASASKRICSTWLQRGTIVDRGDRSSPGITERCFSRSVTFASQRRRRREFPRASCIGRFRMLSHRVSQDDYLPVLVITRWSTTVGNASKYTDSLAELRRGQPLCSDYYSNHRKILVKCVSLSRREIQVKFRRFCVGAVRGGELSLFSADGAEKKMFRKMFLFTKAALTFLRRSFPACSSPCSSSLISDSSEMNCRF